MRCPAIITYLDKGKLVQDALTAQQHAEWVWFDENRDLYCYECPETAENFLLHSENDKPAYIEDNERVHWVHRGMLHRTSGPAFICNSVNNREYHAFGEYFEEPVFLECQPFLQRLEQFCIKNNIAFSKNTANHLQKYIEFPRDENGFAVCNDRDICIIDPATEQRHQVDLNELEAELKRSPSASPVLAALLGAAAIYGASKIVNKRKVTQSA